MTGPLLPTFGDPPDSATDTADTAVAAPAGGAAVARPTAPVQTQSLYRRYRPQSFDADDLVGQEHIVRTLRNAVERGRVAHAYLFCGPRGTGKTTTARLLAKAANCLDPDPRVRPCNRCAACLAITSGATTDVIEIDAASNRGIDDIRDLRERVKYAPTQLRSKFYIIDEAHQITGAAGNAFLKTLEEPPAHTMFVLATTDPEDLLPTIVSRCQRFDFRRIALPAAIARLRTVAAAEGLAVDDDALAAIARAGTGSLRDSLGLLDQLAVYQESEQASDAPPRITVDSVRALLGVSRNDRVETIVLALADRDVSTALEVVNNAVEAGEDPRQLNRQLVTYLRVLMHQLAGGSPDADATARELAGRFDLYDLAKMAQRFSETDVRIRHAAIAQLPFEVALVEIILRPSGTPADIAPARQASGQSQRSGASAPTARPAPAADRPLSEAAQPVEPDVAAGPAPSGPDRSMEAADTGQPTGAVSPPPGPSLKDRVRNSAVRIGQPSSDQAVANQRSAPVPADPPSAPERPSPAASAGPDDGTDVSVQRLVEIWGRIRQDVKLLNRRIEALLAEVDPIAVTEDRVTLRAAYPFHRNRLEEDEVRQVVESVIGKRVGRTVRVRTVLKGEDGDTGSVQLTPTPTAPRPKPARERPTNEATASATLTPPEAPTAPLPASPAHEPVPDPTAETEAASSSSAGQSVPGHEPGQSTLEDENRLLEAARAIFDGEEIPDPLTGEP